MKTFPINSIYLKNRMAELGLKQWWLAEQVGVDKKTVMRWRDGAVKTIREDNLEALLQILECEKSDIILGDQTAQLASIDEQKTAAKLLMTSSLVDKLGPIGEWDVIESLLKATIVENLPLAILGEMYAQLTVSLWRQSKIDEADLFNKKAEEIAKKLEDKVLLAKTLLSKANILSWRGQTKQSIAVYEECLSMEKYLDQKLLGAINSNLGAVYFEAGLFSKAIEYQNAAISLFKFSGKPTNLSIAHCHLAFVCLEQKKYNEARSAIVTSLEQAALDDYKRGKAMGTLVLAEIELHAGNQELALKLLDEGLTSFKRQGIEEGLNYEFAGRILRLTGQLEKSKEMLQRGLELSKKFPLTLASLYFEMGKTTNDKACFAKAIELYKSSESEERAQFVRAYVT